MRVEAAHRGAGLRADGGRYALTVAALTAETLTTVGSLRLGFGLEQQ